MAERTLSIVKPDGVKKNLVGAVIGRFEKAGLKVIALKMISLSRPKPRVFTTCTGQGRFSKPDGIHELRPGRGHGARGGRRD